MAKPKGRPSSYSDEIADIICERIADGESLRTICRDEDMPASSTVFRWLAADEAFQEKYARAKSAQADALVEDILEIVDDARNDWMERRGKDDEGWVANGEHIQRARLRVDARKWMAGKLAPKKYGEKITTEHTGSLTVRHEDMTDDELARIAASGGE
ncbi:MAG: terminase small subunit protein [Salinarimonadaceae bacterium]|nr:MAG: terminase small subunit protein [Salinarimonadaceae bacterium]